MATKTTSGKTTGGKTTGGKTTGGKTTGGKTAPTAAGNEAARHLKIETTKEEVKVEKKTGKDLPKGAARIEERSKSSDGKSAGAKQKG